MPIIHVNRQGKKYYLHTGPRRGGGIQYFFSTKSEGTLAEAIPEGFEIDETVNAAVYLRRQQPKLIREDELEELRRGLKTVKSKAFYRVEARGKVVTIHESMTGLEMTENFAGWASPEKIAQTSEMFAHYQAVLRFVLTDPEARLFQPERFCFRGSVEDWIWIGAPDTLPKLARTYFKHLGSDSLFELC